jgi:tetratricopeptide (TPR) repeat protein
MRTKEWFLFFGIGVALPWGCSDNTHADQNSHADNTHHADKSHLGIGRQIASAHWDLNADSINADSVNDENVNIEILASRSTLLSVFVSFVDQVRVFFNPRETNRLNQVVRPVYYDHQNDPENSKKAADYVNATYYFLLGQKLAQKQNAHSLIAYERTRSFDPNSSTVYLALSQEYLKMNRLEEGVAAARKALELDPKSRDAKMLLANLNANAKRYEEALELFEQVSQEYPDDEEVALYSALAEMERKQFDRAVKKLRTFIDRNPESATAFFYLGRVFQEQGSKQEAAIHYKKAMEIRPGFVLAGTYLGAMQEELKDRAGAQKTYEWLAQETDDPEVHRRLGQMHLDGNELMQALGAFQNLERVQPGGLSNRVRMGLLYLELKDFSKATQSFEWVLDKSPESENIRYYLALLYEQDERHEEALKHFDAIPADSKLYVDSLKRKIFLLGKLQRRDEAPKILDSLFAESQKGDSQQLSFEDVTALAAQYYESVNDFEKVESLLSEGLQKFPKNESFLYMKGSLLEKQGRSDEAIEVMQKLLELNANHAGALNFVGYLWAERGIHLRKAERYILRALALRPKDPFITDSLAWVYYQRGDYAKALDLLNEAFAARPDEPVIADHLADVLVKLGRFDEAKLYYETALKLGPQKEEERKKIEEKLSQVITRINSECTDGPSDCPARMFDPRSPASKE